ncbi:MAG: hypothetical protein WD794_01965 [Mycobacteriales bacterium]
MDSGETDLDRWLREQAAGAGDRRVARTFVWLLTAPATAAGTVEPSWPTL